MKIFIFGLLFFTLSGCVSENSANVIESREVEEAQKIMIENQKAPIFDWSLERHLMIELYKARNSAVITYTYVRNIQGQIIFQCDSIGFPIPSNTQLTNPEADIYRTTNSMAHMALPQPEPNGMYSSPSTSGTFVFCLNEDGSVSPSYFEADVEAHTAKLLDNGSTRGNSSSLSIKTKDE